MKPLTTRRLIFVESIAAIVLGLATFAAIIESLHGSFWWILLAIITGTATCVVGEDIRDLIHYQRTKERQ